MNSSPDRDHLAKFVAFLAALSPADRARELAPGGALPTHLRKAWADHVRNRELADDSAAEIFEGRFHE